MKNPAMLNRINVTAFVDWNSQFHNAGQSNQKHPDRQAEKTIDYVSEKLASLLTGMDQNSLFHVVMRIYHGWYQGLTMTKHRIALGNLIKDELVPRKRSNVRFDWSRPFGDTLADAFDHRKHKRLGIHLPDTLRSDAKGEKREKMVDTALACDLLHAARFESDSWRIVMAEDDDLVPAVFVAEKWSKEKGGRTIILRKRDNNGHLNLNGIFSKMES
ncbi:MAG: hypothetical protein HQL76_11650 [Magnetococcales bacterium]|nr:hypothetical protein [Magnetococcales bacterium]